MSDYFFSSLTVISAYKNLNMALNMLIICQFYTVTVITNIPVLLMTVPKK